MFVSRDGHKLSASSKVFVLLMPNPYGEQVGGVVGWEGQRPAGFVFIPINPVTHAKESFFRLEFETVPDMPGIKRCNNLIQGKWTDKPTGAWNIVPKDDKWISSES